MPVAGYTCTVKVGGTSTAFTTAATTGSGDTWQISDAAKRVLDPEVTPSFFDDGVAISSGDIESIDYLYGRVVFTASKTGPITVTGSYIPLLAFAEAKEFSVGASRTMLDVTVFGNTSHLRAAGLMDADGSIGSFDVLTTDLDSGAGTTKAWTLFTGGTTVLLDVYLGADYCRAWVVIESEDIKASLDDVINSTVNWKLNAQRAADGTAISFAVGS